MKGAKISCFDFRRNFINDGKLFLRDLSNFVNISDFWDTDPVSYFTSLLKNVSYLIER